MKIPTEKVIWNTAKDIKFGTILEYLEACGITLKYEEERNKLLVKRLSQLPEALQDIINNNKQVIIKQIQQRQAGTTGRA